MNFTYCKSFHISVLNICIVLAFQFINVYLILVNSNQLLVPNGWKGIIFVSMHEERAREKRDSHKEFQRFHSVLNSLRLLQGIPANGPA